MIELCHNNQQYCLSCIRWDLHCGYEQNPQMLANGPIVLLYGVSVCVRLHYTLTVGDGIGTFQTVIGSSVSASHMCTLAQCIPERPGYRKIGDVYINGTGSYRIGPGCIYYNRIWRSRRQAKISCHRSCLRLKCSCRFDQFTTS